MNGEVSVKFSRQEAQVLAAIISGLLAPGLARGLGSQQRVPTLESIQFKLEQAIMAGSDELSSKDLSVPR